MKNLFKNLMLVAVAAMAFTACEKGNDETNKTEQKTVITGVATIANDDTRSGFLSKEEGETAYQSAWDGEEKIAIFYDGGNTDTTVDAEGNFSATLDGAVASINVCSPYTAWYSTDTMDMNVLKTQTPRANSVDPAVHILQAKDVAVVDGVASAQMKHEVAYGKMTVNTPEDFEIARVELIINGGTSYNIYATNVVDNVFWFAAQEFTVTELIVKAFNANGKMYSKTITPTPEKPLAFVKGRVSTFSVSKLETEAELTVKSAVAGTHYYGGTAQANDVLVTFTMSTDETFAVAFKTMGNNFITPGNWQSSDWQAANYIAAIYHNGTYVSVYTPIAVSYADGVYTIAPFSVYEWNVGYYDFIGYTGAIEGLDAPETGNEGGEGGEDVPEFTIPGEGSTYDYDFTYTILSEGLNENNAIEVKTTNGLRWNIIFNSGLSEIEAGDYKAVSSFSSSSALECNTYDGGIEYDSNQWGYADDYDNVTINIQKSGDYYCITLIGSGGWNFGDKKYRCVYIGKIK
ncbi:MAG: hypothetical protein IJX40_03455 [Alistipes sp.]|nr:hypothetical protein [Alistipes sp.]